VRKRPLNKRESKAGEDDMVHAASTTTIVVSEPKQAVDLTAYTLQVSQGMPFMEFCCDSIVFLNDKVLNIL